MRVTITTRDNVFTAIAPWSKTQEEIFYAMNAGGTDVQRLGLPMAALAMLVVVSPAITESDLLAVRPNAIRCGNGTDIES